MNRTKQAGWISATVLSVLLFSCKPAAHDRSSDTRQILKAIKNWNDGWDKLSLELTLKDYDEYVDWTNAFGERVRSKKELQHLFERFVTMNNIMAGVQNYVENDVQFLDDEVALVRSQNIRRGEEASDGVKMPDRYISHLRVFQKKGGRWKIVSHMISQPHERQ